ncbi:MAG: Sigma-54-dependent Fis family transcriptional regulator [Candidatus Poribacteria bacterium]|nr:Sigma-54-dependent Fis family transcriptional regulator [Candidatus Poribacteria bacterium]
MLSIFIIGNEYDSRIALTDLLEQHGYRTKSFSDVAVSLEQIKGDDCDLILTDMKIGDVDATEILKSVKQLDPNVEVIVFAESAESDSIKSAVEVMKLGAFDYMLRPSLDLFDELLIKVERALERKRMTEEIERLQEQFRNEYGLDTIIAESGEMRNVLHSVSRVAENDSPILLQGESGTGKELIARAIHSSGRPGKPFVPINCGAMPETLLESELFGHMKGTFTGAKFNKKGLFEEAHGGTLFMDEIGDMSNAIQVKLLRAMDFGEIRRLGSNIPVYVDARVVAATNKDMKSLVVSKKFREDLYYRLNVIPIMIPPLRKRKTDILPLAQHFLKIYSSKMGKEVLRLAPESRQLLLKYDWPGNVRELENVIERAIVLAQYDTIFPDDLPSAFNIQHPDILRQAISGKWSFDRLEKEYISSILSECSGNLSQAREKLGIARNTLWRKMKEYGIS